MVSTFFNLQLPPLLLLSKLLVSRSMDLWKITSIFSICSCVIRRFHLHWSSASLALIIFCFSHYGVVFFFIILLSFRHLYLNGIVKKAISSQNMSNPISFLRRILFRSVLFSPTLSTISSLVTFPDHFIFPFSSPNSSAAVFLAIL